MALLIFCLWGLALQASFDVFRCICLTQADGYLQMLFRVLVKQLKWRLQAVINYPTATLHRHRLHQRRHPHQKVVSPRTGKATRPQKNRESRQPALSCLKKDVARPAKVDSGPESQICFVKELLMLKTRIPADCHLSNQGCRPQLPHQHQRIP